MPDSALDLNITFKSNFAVPLTGYLSINFDPSFGEITLVSTSNNWNFTYERLID
jgi:hypothetical protein